MVERSNAEIAAAAVGFRVAYASCRVEKGAEMMGDFIKKLTGE